MRTVYWARLQLARQELTKALQALPGIELQIVEQLPDFLGALHGAEAAVLADAPEGDARQVVEALTAAGSRVRMLHFISAGREGFEAAGLPSGVQLGQAPGAAAPAVAEHAMALLLALGRRIPQVLAQQAERRWDRVPPASAAWSLEGKTVAVVGDGHIGKEFARRARPFGARLLGLSRASRWDGLVDEALPLEALHEALGRSDAVVLAIALAAQTRHLIDTRALAACRPGALLVNVARGGLLDQQALADALHAGRLGGAALDVVDPEPLPADDPLWGCPRLIISPHFGGSGSPATVARIVHGAVENLRSFASDGTLAHRIGG
ncbi:NAD(P)-dependent oxidoreductase [Ramlibacter sp. AN1015]|uniref:NAD(P)-dependent oxidoreductase n=1 Tax=Ramlibacter sp. AN1015 TaxID=3133428 RepID=UPI0030BFB3F6